MQKALGRGTAYVMGASLILVFCNYLIHVGLARWLGPADYGIFGIVSSLYLLSNAFLTTGIPRSLARSIASNPTDSATILRTAQKLQLYLASVIAMLYIILAFFLAPVLFQDQTLTPYIILVGLSSLPFGIVILYQNGYFNGQREFSKQALLLTSHSILRIIFVFAAVFLGWKVFGVFVGFVLAALSTILLCFLLNKNKALPSNNPEKGVETHLSSTLISYAVPLTIAAVALTFVRDGNVLFIKSLLHDNALAGLYTAALTLSDLPYLVFVGLSLTIMPSIAKSVSEHNLALTHKYITHSLRYLLLFLLPLIALLAANAKVLLHIFYSDAYLSAAPTLKLLALSSFFLIFTLTLASITTGGGRPKIEMSIYLSMALLLIPLNIFLLPLLGIIGAALALTITTAIACIVISIIVYRKFYSFIPLSSLLKIIPSSLLLFLIAPHLNYNGIFFIVNHILLLALYFTILFLLREIKQEDLLFFKNMLKPSKTPIQQNL